MTRRILVAGAGGSPAVNFTRSLRASRRHDYHLVGIDASKYYLHRAETDARYLVPLASDPRYVDVLNDISRQESIDLLHVQNDVEMHFVSALRDRIVAPVFLPRPETVELCLDKFATFDRWSAAGIKVPATVIVHDRHDLEEAFKRFGGEVWIRDTTGAGGRGSIRAGDLETARTWLDFKGGWGTYTAAECLTEKSVTWMSLWNRGELVVAQSRLRLYWELSKLAPSGISGATGGAVTVRDDDVDRIALAAVAAIDGEPHGVFSVDMAYDTAGVPNPTEINIGRFFTTHEFFTRAGLNMPEMLVDLALEGETPPPPRRLNPLEPGLVWIRGMDFEPVMTTLDAIEAAESDLAARLAGLG
jgi:hypothetical protein